MEQPKEQKKRICKTCGQEYVVKPSWKLLFKKPSFDDFITLFIILMVIFSYWAYNHDTKICRDTLNNLSSICTEWNAANLNIRNASQTWKDFKGLTNGSISIIADPDVPPMKMVADKKTNGK